MCSSITACLLLLKMGAAGSPFHFLDRHSLQQLQKEAFHRQELERTRRTRANMETYIKWMEKWQPGSINSARNNDFIQNEIAECRGELEFMKKREQILEWYEQQRKLNPGAETDRAAFDRLDKLYKEHEAWSKAWKAGRIAPTPREKKPIAPLPREKK